MAHVDTLTPIPFLEEADEHGLRLVNASNTMPCQIAPLMWPDKRSPLAACFRIYVDGKSIGVIGQATVASEWTAMRADRCDVHRYVTRAEAIRYVTGQTVHRYKEPKIVANEPKEATMSTPTVKAPKVGKTLGNIEAGTILEAKYKGVTHRLLALSDGALSLHCEHDACVAAPMFKSLSTAGKFITGRVSCEGPKFWTAVPEAAITGAAVAEAAAIFVADNVGKVVYEGPADVTLENGEVVAVTFEVTLDEAAAVDADLAAAHDEAARKERNRKKNAARASKAAANRISKVAGGE